MLRFLLVILLCLLPGQAMSGANVAASIKPIHSLASNLMAGISAPGLIVSAAGSPHGYNLRPSELRMMTQADLLVWTGPELETFLRKPIANKKDGQIAISLLNDVATVEILPAREGGDWGGHAEQRESHDHDHGHYDPHLWLSPHNARAIADVLLEQLIKIDPANAAGYRTNHRRLRKRLMDLERNITLLVSPLRDQKYIVFHDAYQYFEKSFGLHPVGALAVDPDRRPGARRLKELQGRIKEASVVCVFTEPQFEPRLVNILTEGSSARTAVLDPLGADLNPGPELYFDLMQNLAESLNSCLAGKE